MKKLLLNNKSTVILIVAIIVGAIIGINFQEEATKLKPLGDIFLNMLFVITIPLIFLTVTTSIAKMKTPKRLGKILIAVTIVFLVTSLIALVVGFFSTYFAKLVNDDDAKGIRASVITPMDSDLVEESVEGENLIERTVGIFTVDNFSKLLSTNNVIALLVVSIIVGIAIHMTGEKAKPFYDFLESANEVMKKIVKIIMYYAPIGIGCYIASNIGSFNAAVESGYLKTFISYSAIAIAFFFVVYSIYAYIAGGRKGVKKLWENVFRPAVTAAGTCSSIACIPINIEATKKIGVADDIAETTVPLGSSFHKDGSIIGAMFKIMFLVGLYGTQINSPEAAFTILGVALLSSLLITGVPLGGGTIAGMVIVSTMGFPVATLAILTIISTAIDIPATVLNVVGDTASSMIVARVVDGKDWMDKKTKTKKVEPVEAAVEE